MKQTVHMLDCPVAFDHLRVEETGTDVIVFDSETQQFHFMNPTAYVIFQACDGSNSLTDIAALVAAQFEIEDIDSSIQDVTESVDQLRTVGLIK